MNFRKFIKLEVIKPKKVREPITTSNQYFIKQNSVNKIKLFET